MSDKPKPIDPQSALEEIWKMAPRYAQAKANRIYVEEYRRTLKAQLMKTSGVDAIGAQEREAYAHESYAGNLLALKEAVEEEAAALTSLLLRPLRTVQPDSQEEEVIQMPYGKGTYGNKVGRPPKKTKTTKSKPKKG